MSNDDRRHAALFRAIGLSKATARIYQCLSRKNSASVHQLHKELGLSKTTIHDSLNVLQQRGFVKRFNRGSASAFYKAVNIESALTRYGTYLRQLAEDVITDQAKG